MNAYTVASVDEARGLAERAVLGASLHSPAAFDQCRTILKRTDFYTPAHELIWDAIGWVSLQGTAASPTVPDVTLVLGRLTTTGNAAAAGGAPYLATLYGQTVTPANASFYAKIVADAAADRRLVAMGTRLMQGGQGAMGAAARHELITAATSDLDSIADATHAEDVTAVAGDAYGALVTALRSKGAKGVGTGLTEVDAQIGGMVGGQVMVVGARSGCGKTVMAQQIALHVARDLTRPVLLFTLEMTRMEMLARLVASECHINARHLNLADPAMTDDDWDRIEAGVDAVLDLPIHVVDESEMTPGRMSTLVGGFRRRYGDLGLVIVDYVGLMSADRTTGNRQEDMRGISKEFKGIARRHDVPLVVLSQVNRKYLDRPGDGLPRKEDLAASSALENDANFVLLLHRADQDVPQHVRAGEMDVVIAKARSGGSGVIPVLAVMKEYRLADHGGAIAASAADDGWGRAAA